MVLKFEFKSDLEYKFREVAMKKYGYFKGSLQKASEEAFREWIMKNSNKVPKVENPFALIEGVMKEIKGKKNSVNLQHEASRLWMKKSL